MKFFFALIVAVSMAAYANAGVTAVSHVESTCTASGGCRAPLRTVLLRPIRRVTSTTIRTTTRAAVSPLSLFRARARSVSRARCR